MEDCAEIPFKLGEDSMLNADAKFDPSDYLPRRTSRASAHAATKAIIKKSGKEEKPDPGKLTTSSEAAKDEDKEQDHKQEPPRIKKVKRSLKRKSKRQTEAKPHDCRIKLVRCEEDPNAKRWMVSDEQPEESSYKIVYGPASLSENNLFLPQSNGAVLPNKTATMSKVRSSKRTGHPMSKYLSGERQPQASSKPASLNVVVVHPKPGSKIINASQGRKSKSHRLNQMLSDPSVVISPEVSRIMTTGGNVELQCDQCSKTYRVARDLINHKRVAHKVAQQMCTGCAEEFPTGEAMDRHPCKAKYRCDICGVFCKSPGMVVSHKSKAHAKTLGSFMCSVCCFNAASQGQLDAHVCGGKPKIKYSARASSAVMVFPTWDGQPKASSSSSVPSPNIYVNIPPPPVVPGSSGGGGGGGDPRPSVGSMGSNPLQFLCEVCLSMFPDGAALASHKCHAAVGVNADPSPKSTQPSTTTTASATPRAVPPHPLPNVSPSVLPLEVMPEVEQLAKFYSSVVFME